MHVRCAAHHADSLGVSAKLWSVSRGGVSPMAHLDFAAVSSAADEWSHQQRLAIENRHGEIATASDCRAVGVRDSVVATVLIVAAMALLVVSLLRRLRSKGRFA
jgi:hypothetical protein